MTVAIFNGRQGRATAVRMRSPVLLRGVVCSQWARRSPLPLSLPSPLSPHPSLTPAVYTVTVPRDATTDQPNQRAALQAGPAKGGGRGSGDGGRSEPLPVGAAGTLAHEAFPGLATAHPCAFKY